MIIEGRHSQLKLMVNFGHDSMLLYDHLVNESIFEYFAYNKGNSNYRLLSTSFSMITIFVVGGSHNV
jgi:hypothetical protein